METVEIHNRQKTIPISRVSVQEVASSLLRRAKIPHMQLIVHFVGKKKITSLHEEFFDDPTPTDCITFPLETTHGNLTSAPQVLGEIYICPLIAKEYVARHGGNLYEEITLYLVHGFLHLLGFDDTSATKEKKMRQAEKTWIQALHKQHLAVTPS